MHYKLIGRLMKEPSRIQTCPNCLETFIVKKLGTIYCSIWCANTHYNHFKRGKPSVCSLKPLEEHRINSLVDNLKLNPEQNENEPDLTDLYKVLQENIRIFNTLPLDEKRGTLYTLEDLYMRGVNFDAYEIQARYHNINEEYKSRYLIYGAYKVFLVDYKTVLVYKEKNP